MPPTPLAGDRESLDLRAPGLGVVAWCGALVGLARPGGLVALGLAGVAIAGWARRSGRGRAAATALAAVVVLSAVGVGAATRAERLTRGPVAALAEQRAAVSATVTVTSDARASSNAYADTVIYRGRLDRVTGRGTTFRSRAPVLVLAPAAGPVPELGATVRTTGRLAPADGDLAALLLVRGPPTPVTAPDAWWQGAAAVRTALRDSVSGRPPEQRALVPALVTGDDAQMPPDLVDDFRVTGLTHLTAVSGTNLTLLVGFLLVVARWAGVRGRGLYAVAAGGIVGFLLLARAEPSVVRAAAMGSVALLGLGRNGLHRGLRSLGVAVVTLLLIDPWLATTAGFALSVLATAGILLLGPPLRDALAHWLPRWAAEAVAVPTAAQVACTPVVAAISGQVSLVAVAANLLAAPAVAPVTVLGLAAGLLGVLWDGGATLLGTLAAWCAAWLVAVARWGARLPGAALGWGTGPLSLALLTGACLVLAIGLPRLVRRRATGIACCALLVLVVLARPPTPGWPPKGWVLVACDVGQGDALVLPSGPGSAVVVDTGPDPTLLDRCLDRLGVERVPLLVLTHFHADHVGGLAGLLAGRPVGEVDVTSVAEPADQAAAVGAAVRGAGVAMAVPTYSSTRRVGRVRLQILGPTPGAAEDRPGPEGDRANDASLVVLAEVAGVRMLLTGDIEPPAQETLAASLPGLAVDVLKVPHHGSRYQDLDLLLSLGARVAVVSVGADNTYGHPAEATLDPLTGAGLRVLRTDQDGDVAVVEQDGRLLVQTSR